MVDVSNDPLKYRTIPKGQSVIVRLINVSGQSNGEATIVYGNAMFLAPALVSFILAFLTLF